MFRIPDSITQKGTTMETLGRMVDTASDSVASGASDLFESFADCRTCGVFCLKTLNPKTHVRRIPKCRH